MQYSDHEEPTSFKVPKHGQVDDSGPASIWDAWVSECISLYMVFFCVQLSGWGTV